MKTKTSLIIIFSMLLSSLLFAANNSNVKAVAKTQDDNIVHITNKAQFNDELADNTICLVDFYADWCGPCKMLTPTIEELAKEYKGKVTVIKVNVDNNRDLAEKYQIRGIPNIKIFYKGSLSEDLVGLRQKEVYQNALNKLLSELKK